MLRVAATDQQSLFDHREIDFRPPPKLGGHTHEVLTNLGIADETIDSLAASGIIKMSAQVIP